MTVRKDGGSASGHASGGSAAGTSRWDDLKLAAQALLSPSVPFLVDSLAGLIGSSGVESRRTAGNALESAAFVITPEAAARWSDPKLAAQMLLSESVPLIAEQGVAHPPCDVDPRGANSALESAEPPVRQGASRWDDLRLAAQLLTDTSACSETDALLAYARARRLTLAAAAAALEAWDATKHPRGGFTQNRGWWSPTAGSGSQAGLEPVHGGATITGSPVGAKTAALFRAGPAGTAPAPSAPPSRSAPLPARTTKPIARPSTPPSKPAPAAPAPPSSGSRPAAKPPASSPGPTIARGLVRGVGIASQVVSAPSLGGSGYGQPETGLLQTAGYYLKKLVDSGKITKEEANVLLQELLRLYRANQPSFSGSPAEQRDQHLALLQQAVVSLLTKTALAGLPAADQERIAKAVVAALGKPDYRTFDLEKVVQAARQQITAQAAKSSKPPGSTPPATGKPPAQPASGASPKPAAAGQGGGKSGGSGGGSPPVAQGPNSRPDDDGKGKFRGGRHGDTKGPTGDQLDSHHMPAKSVNGLSEDEGPAIQMEPADHAKTASNGARTGSDQFRDKQARLIKEGRFGEAIQMDIDDIRSKFGSKYDQAIREMIESLEDWMKTGLREPH